MLKNITLYEKKSISIKTAFVLKKTAQFCYGTENVCGYFISLETGFEKLTLTLLRCRGTEINFPCPYNTNDRTKFTFISIKIHMQLRSLFQLDRIHNIRIQKQCLCFDSLVRGSIGKVNTGMLSQDRMFSH